MQRTVVTYIDRRAETPEQTFGGQATTFYVAVRNDGNVFLSGCTLTLCEYDDGRGAMPVEGASVAITFNKDTLQESAYNPKGVDGKLQDIEDDYALAPGKKSVYAVTVRIPESWAGEKKVTFAASDAKRADTYRDGELVAEAADDVAHVGFYAEPGTVNLAGLRASPDSPSEQYFMNTLTLQSVMDETLASAPVTESSASASAIAGGGTVGGRAQARTQSRTLPDTGDSAPSGALATGLAVAGAAVLAYERRRAENERE